MTGLGDLEQVIARLEQATAEAREATREVHSAVKAARGAEKDLTDLLARVGADIPNKVNETIGVAIEDGLVKYAEGLKDAITKGRAAVQDSFDRITKTCLYGNEQGRGISILDEIRVQLELGRDALAAQNDALPRLRKQKGWNGEPLK